MIRRKISCILVAGMVMAILPLTAFASEDSPIPEQLEYELTAEETVEEPVCSHTVTTESCSAVAGERKHATTVLCTCGETISQIFTDCLDESGDGKCDTCQQEIVLEEEPEPETEPAAEPETEPATEPAAESETEPATEPAAEPETEPATEPAAEPETEPITESQTEPEQEEEPEVLSGDVNADGEITSEDAMRILKFVAGLEEKIEESIADVNTDGIVTAADAACILGYCAGLTDTLSA